MIDHEQLAEALHRLDARDREVLHLSLRRRVPDADLGEVLGVETQDVARRRAAAIDKLAEDMQVQRGEDLGHMLKALLEQRTWDAADAIDAAGAAGAEAEPAAPPEPVGIEPEVTKAAADAGDDGEREPEPSEVSTETAVADAPGNGAGASKPVLEMLGRPAEPEKPRDSSRAASRILAGTLGAAALIAAAGFAGATLFGKDDSSSGGQGASEERHFTSKGAGPAAAPFPSEPQAACYSTAYISRGVTLYRKPRGRKELRIAPRTEWRSPRILSVVKHDGDWIAVQAAELRNGQVGWMRRNQARIDCVRWSLKVDVSKRALFVRKNGHTVRRVTIAVGGPGHSTPLGRFAVTDRLKVVDKGSPYGCCVLALTGHQRKLPPGWPGGDRLAIHATNDTESIGKAVSLGCMRAAASQARWLIESVPLGTPVFIRS
ncbi:MAG TPA: L,D-transpeptidase [Thermoleophilaceae bacterium]|jgi:hypothetical protein